MDIIDLSNEYEDTYCRCLEDWSAEMAEAGDAKRKWLEKKKTQGLRVKLARNDAGRIVGMIQYAPVEHSPVIGRDLYYIYCVWVHGHRQGQGNWQKRGIGRMLLAAAEDDCRSLGAKGIAAWGILLPFFMRSKWFRKQGYRRADRLGMIELTWKPFDDSAEAPKLVRRKKKPESAAGFVTVTCFRNGWCPGQNLSCERAKRVAGEFGDAVRCVEIDTDERAALEEWGIADAVFVGDREITNGPPLSAERIRRKLAKSVKRLRKRARL